MGGVEHVNQSLNQTPSLVLHDSQWVGGDSSLGDVLVKKVLHARHSTNLNRAHIREQYSRRAMRIPDVDCVAHT